MSQIDRSYQQIAQFIQQHEEQPSATCPIEHVERFFGKKMRLVVNGDQIEQREVDFLERVFNPNCHLKNVLDVCKKNVMVGSHVAKLLNTYDDTHLFDISKKGFVKNELKDLLKESVPSSEIFKKAFDKGYVVFLANCLKDYDNTKALQVYLLEYLIKFGIQKNCTVIDLVKYCESKPELSKTLSSLLTTIEKGKYPTEVKYGREGIYLIGKYIKELGKAFLFSKQAAEGVKYNIRNRQKSQWICMGYPDVIEQKPIKEHDLLIALFECGVILKDPLPGNLGKDLERIVEAYKKSLCRLKSN
jgi:hypothetical protein